VEHPKELVVGFHANGLSLEKGRDELGRTAPGIERVE
jgi:hypothetical protein